MCVCVCSHAFLSLPHTHNTRLQEFETMTHAQRKTHTHTLPWHIQYVHLVPYMQVIYYLVSQLCISHTASFLQTKVEILQQGKAKDGYNAMCVPCFFTSSSKKPFKQRDTHSKCHIDCR
mmetsp:Transcript_23928/g.35142  ORF Transcript_23928/g.35142 Transcript_23928/m.35142 type:complete len:119 (-) Transcript_23928:18-374(-)